MAMIDVLSSRFSSEKSVATGPELRLEQLTLLALLLTPTVYLSVRHGIHACLFLLLALAMVHMARYPTLYRQSLAEPGVKPLLFAFAALFAATATTQVLRWKLQWSSFDGPSKILLGAAVFLFLRTRGISFVRVLEVGLPLGLLAIGLAALFNPDPNAFWEGRFTTSFVDPNSLGSQSLILSLLCLFSIRLLGKEPPWLLGLKVTAVSVGIYIAVHTQSRGGWLAIPPMLALWLILQFGRIKDKKPGSYLLPIVLVCAAVAAMALSYEYSTIISSRGNHAYADVSDWLNEKNLDSPAGIRLSIWKISLSLALDSPWLGYGETGIAQALAHHPLSIPAYRSAIETLGLAGPHSDILAKLLYLGLAGLFAYVATMVIPWLYFWNRRGDADPCTLAASHLGMYFITGVVICGLTNEMLSLKYLCTFFGLMIAGLAADATKSRRVK